MSDLFQLPDGKLIRRGNSFTLTIMRNVVVPALIELHDNGDQSIAEAARVEQRGVEQQFPANWLGVAVPEQLAALGITPIEEQPDGDPLYFMSSPMDVKDGVLRKQITPRPIEQLREWMKSEVSIAAGNLISETYPTTKQLNDIAMVLAPDTPDADKAKAINRGKWIRDVLAYKAELQADVEEIADVAYAKAWRETPAEWPKFPGG